MKHATDRPELRIAVIGDGKMGKAVANVARDAGYAVTTVIGESTPITSETLAGADVAIEFTQPDAAVANVKACIDVRCPVVVGTTGWYPHLDELTTYVSAHEGALLWAANFSLGVHLFAELVRYAGELMARVPGFDMHLVETHHTAKKDAPSGTALMLQRTLHDAMTVSRGGDVPITSIRVGAVPGTHELICDATYEQISVTHVARDRRVFAEGAVAAARWLAEHTRAHGGRGRVFTLADMLGTKESSHDKQ